jgi:hypothetical protein
MHALDMDDNMKKKALAWSESRKTIRSCDCCGQNSWTFGEDIVTTPILSGGGMVIGGKSYPKVVERSIAQASPQLDRSGPY